MKMMQSMLLKAQWVLLQMELSFSVRTTVAAATRRSKKLEQWTIAWDIPQMEITTTIILQRIRKDTAAA